MVFLNQCLCFFHFSFSPFIANLLILPFFLCGVAKTAFEIKCSRKDDSYVLKCIIFVADLSLCIMNGYK